MSNYYSMKDGKVAIAHELMNRGWKVYGYKEDRSDSMTDYFDPANWEGIATKNGFVLVVDSSDYNYQSGKEITKYNPKGNLSFDDREKINKLEAMTTKNGCTEGEEENAKQLIERIKNKTSDHAAYEVIDTYPVYMANPGKCKWHIEKDGKVFDKGTGITKYADLPRSYMFDFANMKYKDSYKHWNDGTEKNISDNLRKVITDFKNLMLRFERVVNSINPMGDGTTETEKEGIEQQAKEGYEKIIEKVTKKVLKMVEVKRDYFQEGDYLTISHHGHYWKITKEYMQKGTWKGITESRKAFVYEIVGSASRGYQKLKNPNSYYDYEFRMLKDLEAEKTKIFELKEVEEIQEIEKWVKIDKSKTNKQNKNNEKQQPKQTEQQPQPTTEQKETNNNNLPYKFTITADTDTRDNSSLWVLKIIDKLSKEEYIKVSEHLKTLKGYYSKFKHGFIFRYDPTSKLIGGEEENSSSQTSPNDLELKADTITDHSTSIAIELNLKGLELESSQEYKNKLVECLINNNITITDAILKYIEFENLKNVLIAIRTEAEQKQQQEKQQAEKTSLIEKIDKNINSLESKINNLSGDYQTNTYKRMQEAENRYNKINKMQIEIKILEYVKGKLINNIPITDLEKRLTVSAFRDDIHNYYNSKYGKYPREIKFPSFDSSLPSDGWYNKELPQRQKKLTKYGITNTQELNNAVDEYKIIYNSINQYTSEKDQQIKKLSNQYKLQQKGDINFTPAEVVEKMIQYANINHNSKVLEPSSGIGNIADKIKAITEHVDVCEQMYSFSELLKLKGHNIVSNNFLEYNKQNYYDAIIMNPPFSNNQDITHLKHAYNLLKNNGTLVCITSPHWTFANDKASQNFKEWIEEKNYYTEELPSGTFEMTNVRSQIIVIEKNEEVMQEAI